MNGPNGTLDPRDLRYKLDRERTVSAASTTSFGSIAGFSDIPVVYEGVDTADGRCICFRPLMRVICKVCAHNIEGRVARKCEAHPTTRYLLDINRCPNLSCKSRSPLLEEQPFAPGYVPLQENIKIR